MFCVRVRNVSGNEFLEVFAEGTPRGLRLPERLPPRFANRVIKTLQVAAVPCGPCGPYGPPYRPALPAVVTVHVVNSVASAACGVRTKANILSDGMWLVESDWIPKGGVPGHVPGVATAFGVPVYGFEAATMAAWRAINDALHVDALQAPIVVYHGTAKDSVKKIVKETLQPTFGMFGTAVYFGSFWKAYRFAVLTQDYADREGATFRCLAFWRHVHVRNSTTRPTCDCTTCNGAVTYSDHLATWTRKRGISGIPADAVLLLPVAPPPTTHGQSGPKGSVRNEEYAALTAERVHLDGVGFVKRRLGPTTVAAVAAVAAIAASQFYDPWDRSVCIE